MQIHLRSDIVDGASVPADNKMTSTIQTNPPRSQPRISDFWAYLLPMAIFMGFTWVGGTWSEYYPATYVAKAITVAVALIVLWPRYTRIKWDYCWLGVIFGILGI